MSVLPKSETDEMFKEPSNKKRISIYVEGGTMGSTGNLNGVKKLILLCIVFSDQYQSYSIQIRCRFQIRSSGTRHANGDGNVPLSLLFCYFGCHEKR
jgi:hypothetical protein